MSTTLKKNFSSSLLVIGMCFSIIFVPTLVESQTGKKISNSLGMEFVSMPLLLWEAHQMNLIGIVMNNSIV
jgi:hypothetical protein